MRWIRLLMTAMVMALGPLLEAVLKWTLIIITFPILGMAGVVMLIGSLALCIGIPFGLLGVWADSPHGYPWLIASLKWAGAGIGVAAALGGIGGFYGASRAILIQRFNGWMGRSFSRGD